MQPVEKLLLEKEKLVQEFKNSPEPDQSVPWDERPGEKINIV
jgi:hypothetical protein